jgi:hypothetical protein
MKKSAVKVQEENLKPRAQKISNVYNFENEGLMLAIYFHTNVKCA